MPKHLTESVDGSITAIHEFTTGTCRVSTAGTFQTNTVAERTSGSGVTVDGILLKDSQVTLTKALSVDHTASGIVDTFTAGEDLVFGNLCYFKSDGKMWKTDADASTTMPGVAIAIATIAADASGLFIQQGWLRDDSWAWTVGNLLYASTTPGALTATAPSGSGDQVQRVAWVYSATVVYFNPSSTTIEVL